MFVYPVGEGYSTPTPDHEKYCKLFNNIVNNTLSVDANISDSFISGYSSVSTVSFCATHDSGGSAIKDDQNVTIIEPGKRYKKYNKSKSW
jgi:hypothetical protein